MKDRHIGVPEVIEKWGVPPEKMIDLQALSGDSVDNVPGVPGIGPKTAALLLGEYGDLETLLTRASEIKQNKRRENLIEFADLARISRELVKLRDDVPVIEQLDDLILNPLDGAKLIAFLKAMEFTSLTRRVGEATQTEIHEIDAATVEVETTDNAHGPDLDKGDATKPTKEAGTGSNVGTPAAIVARRVNSAMGAKIDTGGYLTISDAQTLKDWCDAARESGIVAFDTETTSLDPMVAELVGFSLGLADGTPEAGDFSVRAAYVPLAHRSGADDLLGGGPTEGQINFAEAKALLKELLEDPSVLKIAQNIKYDYLVMRQHGVEIRGFDDTMLLSYVLDAGTGGHGMDALADRWLGHTPIAYKEVTGSGKNAISFAQVELDKATAYAAEDADVTFRLWHQLKPRLAADSMTRVYERLERPLAAVLARMEERGIAVDRQILSRLSGELAQKAAELEAEIHEMAGEKFNVGSPKQLGEILFGKMSLAGGSKTKSGQWSTSAQVLEDLAAEGHELPRRIVDWRQMTKLKSTYTDALPGYINEKTKRVHTSFSMAATTTGRLSSSEPNLQNIPIRTAEGRKIRTAFIAEPGNLLISADYSQIELRVLAHVADIPQLTQAFADGVDIHAMTASEMFEVPIKDMPAEVRRRAKAINFGIIYGISAFGLANQLGIGRSEASDYIKKYFERFPGIRDYMEDAKTQAREKGYVETIFGRRAHYPEIKASNPQVRAFNERAAINAPIQGSAADVIRRAMIRMESELEIANVEAQMLLQVHDELIFECAEDVAEKAIPVIVRVMENAAMPAVSMKVPLKVEAHAALNWDEAH